MFGSKAEKEVSDSTISRRIHDMSADIEETVCTSVEESEMFALQVDESTDIAARWLSRGKVLSRVCKLKEEMLTFSTLEQQEEFCDLLADDTWCAKYSYLAKIFELLNKVKASMQGKSENVLSSTDKIKALKEKLQLWGGKVKEGNLDMFSHVAVAANSGEIIPIISEHLVILEKQLQQYFTGMCTENYDWIRNPLVASISTISQLTLMEEERLVELRHDRDLKLLHMQLPLDEFWVQIKTKYSHAAKKPLVMLIQFSTSYQCNGQTISITTFAVGSPADGVLHNETLGIT
ncbi:zinc finger BED domain-containing protein 5-like [Palaemon carinicauda]|uniref:zinc finger BED domain-containing protein 5-like n=1 Tax=Palaemon carinicauda TaxID=392227 RepID=UPI0035B5747E